MNSPNQVDSFIERFEQPDLVGNMYYRAIVAIGDSIKHGDCWVYPTVNPDGYGQTSVGGRTITPSRLVLCCATHQPMNYKMDACHRTPLCRFRACCNPEHLYWDTRKNNIKRRQTEAKAREAAKQFWSPDAGDAACIISYDNTLLNPNPLSHSDCKG